MPSSLSGLTTGNLIFVQDTTGMGSAITQATGSYTHVAIIECTDSGILLWEAIPSGGVVCQPIDSIPESYMPYTLCRVNIPFDTLQLIANLHQYMGQPYDYYFEHDNGRIYCSELVYECFFDLQGKRLFEAKPMNFKSSDGTMPAYWIHLFDSLGAPIPQGQPGTNPTDLQHSACLDVIRVF